MKGKVTFKDTLSGNLTISDNKRKYFKTKDSTSPSGHSLVAQIEMTHAGIVTRNYGFYLPARMKDGAATFTKDYAKPVIIGHDELVESKPVGRVVNAEYVDTAEAYKVRDSILKSYFNFQDGSKKVTDFVQHVVRNYDGKDQYKGLGHIRGTVNITDAETIEAILDERYLTVSTSMISDAAYCSVCNTDWVADGFCEHQRGQVYDDKVCLAVPGTMSYDHLGIINSPADVHANGFDIVSLNQKTTENDSSKVEGYQYQDTYDIAANLFAYKDDSLVSLSSETEANLITIKDNIQKVEDAMSGKDKTKDRSAAKADPKINNDAVTETDLLKKIEDEMRVSVGIYSYGEEGNRDITVGEYVKDLDQEALTKLVTQVAEIAKGTTSTMDDSDESTKENDSLTEDEIKAAIDKFFKDAYSGEKEVNSIGDNATEMLLKNLKYWDADDSNFNEDELAMGIQVEKEHNDNIEIATAIAKAHLMELPDYYTRLASMEEEGKKYWDAVNEGKTGGQPNQAGGGYSSLAGDDDSAKKTSLAELDAEKVYELMSEHIEEDSRLTKEVRDNLKATTFCGAKGFFPVTDAVHYNAVMKVLDEVEVEESARNRIVKAADKLVKRLNIDLNENFDKGQNSCDNTDVTENDLLKVYKDTKKKLIELGVELEESKNQEVEILDAQLDAANEEIDSLENVVSEMKKELAENLATQIIDKRLAKGSIVVEDKAEALKELMARNLDSLKDTLRDINKELEKNDGIDHTPEGKIDNPVLQNDHDTKIKSNSLDKYELYDKYRSICNTRGKKVADGWLGQIQQKNGIIPTID